MEQEIIDDSQHNLPAEAVVEIKGAAKWMTTSAIILIIFAILGLLGNLGNLTQGTSVDIFLSIISNGISIYLGFMIIKTSGFLNSYADRHEEDSLLEGLKLIRLYWMISVLLILASFVLSFFQR